MRSEEVAQLDPAQGFRAFGPMEHDVRRLAWCYDDLGVLTAHGVVTWLPCPVTCADQS